jgi:hypothetical protein
MLSNLGATENGVVIAHEKFENSEFFGGEVNEALAATDGERERIEGEVADTKDRVAGSTLAAKEGTDAGEELGEGKRFDEIVVRAAIESGDAISYAVAGSEHKDRGVAASSAELTTEGKPIHLGEHDIEDDGVIVVIDSEGETRFSVVGDITGISPFGETLSNKCGELRLIFDDEYTHRPYPCSLDNDTAD